ncbi:MAG: hypothetical protein ACN23H_02425 [Candidatus Phytoplasma vitis]|nr:MAG: hypothetical protein M6G77_01675 [Candidatus Phytoplasma vitis]
MNNNFFKKHWITIIISLGIIAIIATIIYFTMKKDVKQIQETPLPSYSESKSQNEIESVKTPNEIILSETKQEIELQKKKENEEQYLSQKPKIKRNDIKIMSKEYIPNYMKLLNIDDVIVNSNISLPVYNKSNEKNLYYCFKNPSEDLLGAYFIHNSNPFNIEYPSENNKYELIDLLKNEISISEAYIFWELKQKPQDTTKQYIEHEIDHGPVNNMQQATEEWIKNNVKGNITSNDKNWGNCIVKSTDSNNNYHYTIKCQEKEEKQFLINLGPVNNMQQATEEYIKNNVKGIIIDNNNNWGNCLVVSTDTNYSYAYLIKCTQLEIIDLDDSLDPKQTILDWKKENKFIDSQYEGKWETKISTKEANILLPLIIIDVDFKEGKITPPTRETIDFDVSLSIVFNSFNDLNKTYLICCSDHQPKINEFKSWREKYRNWSNSPEIEAGEQYFGNAIRSRFGKSNRTIYDDYGQSHNYRYETGWTDDWYIDNNKCTGIYNYNLYIDSPPSRPNFIIPKKESIRQFGVKNTNNFKTPDKYFECVKPYNN